MKTFITYIIFIALLVSCQEEINVNTSNENTNNKESVYTAKAERNNMLDGTIDDVLDNNPCTALNLPVQIELNNTIVTIVELTDLDILNENDLIELVYPITVTKQNYTTVAITNEEELLKLQEECTELINSDRAPITCVSIDFPISIFTIVDNNKQDTIEITSKEEYFNYLTNLSSSEIYSVDYPISLQQKDSTTITVQNDKEYLDVLDACGN
ncbi:hypothetical protein HX109_02110 [Galbibacter sp. BG1]|uniref:hypothetical protein n=1 Tax=Galbibacter sp. BG1 TaxID=1170699 RepID=UPI0015B96F11|nr:hypothetical protein [Galbibacter sp. BG1]QLE00409.1 hypothetical protein HX109_02110 [Galbibacter sp. BG1]